MLYVYATARQDVHRRMLSGEDPDVQLYGLNHMASLGIQAEFFDNASNPSIPVRAAGLLHTLAARHTGMGFNVGQALERLGDSRRYDVVFATTDSVGLPSALLRLLKLTTTPLVMASQGLTSHATRRGMNRVFRVYRQLLRHADRIVHYGYGEGEELHRLFGIPRDKLTWIPLGTDADYFQLSSATTEDVVLAVGRDQFRDYSLLLQVAARTNIRFRIITSRHSLRGLAVPSNVELIFDVP